MNLKQKGNLEKKITYLDSKEAGSSGSTNIEEERERERTTL